MSSTNIFLIMSIFYIIGIVLNILAQHKYITESSSHALKGKLKANKEEKKIKQHFKDDSREM